MVAADEVGEVDHALRLRRRHAAITSSNSDIPAHGRNLLTEIGEECAPGLMSMQVTVCPRATSKRTRRWPMKPVPPMMKTDIHSSRAWSNWLSARPPLHLEHGIKLDRAADLLLFGVPIGADERVGLSLRHRGITVAQGAM
jgi:hypothetical protein